jgi:hypothetical protein
VDRYCIKEEFQRIETPPYHIENGVAIEGTGPTQAIKIWNFYYSDGAHEQVIQTGPAK